MNLKFTKTIFLITRLNIADVNQGFYCHKVLPVYRKLTQLSISIVQYIHMIVKTIFTLRSLKIVMKKINQNQINDENIESTNIVRN